MCDCFVCSKQTCSNLFIKLQILNDRRSELWVSFRQISVRQFCIVKLCSSASESTWTHAITVIRIKRKVLLILKLFEWSQIPRLTVYLRLPWTSRQLMTKRPASHRPVAARQATTDHRQNEHRIAAIRPQTARIQQTTTTPTTRIA